MKVYEIEVEWNTIRKKNCLLFINTKNHGKFSYGLYSTKELANKMLAHIDINALAKKSVFFECEVKGCITYITEYEDKSAIDISSYSFSNGDGRCIMIDIDAEKLNYSRFDACRINCHIIEKEVEEVEEDI